MKQIFNSLNTGDINLASALMSIGIPMDQKRPCDLVLSDDGRNYMRFHLLPSSVDGVLKTEHYFHYWKNPSECRDTNFDAVMQFVISGRKESCRYAEEWFDYAHDYLRERNQRPENAPTTIEGVKAYLATDTDSDAAHVFAFCYNRLSAYLAMKKARRQIMIRRGNTVGMIDTDLNKRDKRELLARIED